MRPTSTSASASSSRCGPTIATTIPPPVAATAGSAAFCKWSLFRRGYLDAWGLPPETLALLAALAGVVEAAQDESPDRPPPSASPLAHRCYQLRATMVGETLRRVWRRGQGTVVVLGAGMDGLGLASLARASGGRGDGGRRLVEVDCPEVVAKKQAALGKVSASVEWLPRLLGPKGVEAQYCLVAADLRDPAGSVAGALAPWVSAEQEALFVLEAVLGYLPPERATALLRWIAATYANATVLIVDTGGVASLAGAGAGDAVAHAVVGAFAARGCPVEGLRPWGKDGASVALALRGYGFPHVWPSDLWDAGAALVPAGRLLVPSGVVDPFDEYAAWQLFARQSLVAIAGTAAAGPLFQALTESPLPSSSSPTTTACLGQQAAQLQALEARMAALEMEKKEQQKQQKQQKQKESRKAAAAGAVAAATAIDPDAPLVVRCFRPEDAEAVRALVATGRAGAAEGRPAVARFLRKALDGDLAAMEERYAGGERFWVLEAGAAAAAVVVGCVGLRAPPDGGAREGEIVRLTVADGWQRRGLGRRLLRHAEAHARDRCGLALVRATTLDEAALPGACAFYVSEGYVVEGRQAFGKSQGELVHVVKRF